MRSSAFSACGLRNSRAEISQSLLGAGVTPVALFGAGYGIPMRRDDIVGGARIARLRELPEAVCRKRY